MIGNATRRTIIGAAAGAAVIAMSRAAPAQTPLRVIVFATLSNLAQFAAQTQGYYTKRGLAVDLINTPNSDELRYGLAQGRYDIAHAGGMRTEPPASVPTCNGPNAAAPAAPAPEDEPPVV